MDGCGLMGIAPTVLTLFGLPAGQDMPGRVFTEAFEESPAIARIPTWEAVSGPHPDGRHPSGTPYGLDEGQGRALLEQFVALGYLDPLGKDRGRAATRTRQEQHWTLAQAHLANGQHAAAAELLLPLVADRPDRGDFVLALAECLARLRATLEAQTLVESLLADRPGWPAAQYLRGSVHLLRREFPEALNRFAEAAQSGFDSPTLQLQIGQTLYRMKRYPLAREAFERAAVLDPHLAAAHLGLAGCALFEARFSEAAGHALDAVARQHTLVPAHLTLGLALERLGQPEDAGRAYRTLLSIHPGAGFAHWRLGKLLLERPETAAEGWRHLDQARQTQAAKRARRRAAREQAAALRTRFTSTLEAARPVWRQLEARKNAGQPETPQAPVIIVSGLPRSGTSLMMQMLQAGGVPLLTDGERTPDEDNPEGYLEWEPIKTEE